MPGLDRLTHRQLQVLELVAAGKSNKEIARLLGCSQDTVKDHVEAILGRLHVENRAAAAATFARATKDS